VSVNGNPEGQTDNSGNFSLYNPDATDGVEISYIGRKTLSVAGGLLQQSETFTLVPDPDNLPAVVITPGFKNAFPWLLVGGAVLLASTNQKKTVGKIEGSTVALIGIGVVGAGVLLYMMRKPAAAASQYPQTASQVISAGSGGGFLSALANQGSSIWSDISSLLGSAAGLFSNVNTQPVTSLPSGPLNVSDSYDQINTTAPSLNFNLGSVGDILSSDPTYNAGSIIGKTLVAKRAVTAFNLPSDDASPVADYDPGDTIGVVTSYLEANPSAGRSDFYWQFMDYNGNYRYVPHHAGDFDIGSLQDQGILTTQQQEQAAAEANKSTIEKIVDQYAPWLVGGIIAVPLIGVLLKNSK
jgi:hypothetical protein